VNKCNEVEKAGAAARPIAGKPAPTQLDDNLNLWEPACRRWGAQRPRLI